MGARDEFDNESDAPVPPHERPWRHPAEVNDALRQAHTLESTPPPIGRRAAALVAFVSLVASATLLLVTVQKGVSEPVAEQADPATTTTVGKGSLPPGTARAVRAFGDYFVLPSAEVSGRTAVVEAGGRKSVHVVVVTRIADKGIVIVRGSNTGPATAEFRPDPPFPREDAQWSVVDRSNQRLPVHIGLNSGFSGFLPLGTGDWFPLDVDGVINGVGALLADEHFYAIAVRHNHRHFGIALDDLKKIIRDASVAGNG